MKDLFPWTFGPKLWVHTIYQNALYMGVHDTRQNTVSGEPFLSLRQTQILPCLSTRLTCGDLWPPKFKETLSFSVVKDPWFTNLSSLWRDSRTLLRPPNPYENSMTSPPCGLPLCLSPVLWHPSAHLCRLKRDTKPGSGITVEQYRNSRVKSYCCSCLVKENRQLLTILCIEIETHFSGQLLHIIPGSIQRAVMICSSLYGTTVTTRMPSN